MTADGTVHELDVIVWATGMTLGHSAPMRRAFILDCAARVAELVDE